MNNDSQPDQQKRPILDKEGLYDTPNISAVFNKEGFPDNLIFSAILFIRFGVHHYVEEKQMIDNKNEAFLQVAACSLTDVTFVCFRTASLAFFLSVKFTKLI